MSTNCLEIALHNVKSIYFIEVQMQFKLLNEVGKVYMKHQLMNC